MHRFRYTILLVIAFIVAWAIGRYSSLDQYASVLAETNTLLFMFISGAMYSFSFTAGLAVVLFSDLSVSASSLLPLAVVGALGGLLADLLIFRFIKDVIFHELGGKAERFMNRAMKTPMSRISLQILGAVIIASPFPDEIGLTFMGISRISFWRLVALTFLLDTIGIYTLMVLVSTIL